MGSGLITDSAALEPQLQHRFSPAGRWVLFLVSEDAEPRAQVLGL